MKTSILLSYEDFKTLNRVRVVGAVRLFRRHCFAQY